jgi:hypothetical protein
MNVFGQVGWWEPVVNRAGVSQETGGVSNEEPSRVDLKGEAPVYNYFR